MNSGVEMHAVYGIALNRSSYSQSEACPALVNNTPNHMISMRHFPSSEADIFENAFLQQRTKELIMVFRGKPSRSCGRCRDRRLRCDFKSGGCGQCARAGVCCSGYRDTQQLRIQNDTQSVARKSEKIAHHFEPRSLSISIDSQARDAFFIYYATGTSKCWNFLTRYYHPTGSPDHLTLAIEAVSLAYFWHHVYSDAVLTTARERYILALRMTNKMLKVPKEASKYTTFLTSLLLDLYEKITDSERLNSKSWTSHIDGALALVRLRGLEQFQDPTEFHALVRLINHHIASCVVTARLVPDDLIAIRDYVTNDLNIHDHTIQLSDLTVAYAKLRSEIRTGILSNDEIIEKSMSLDLKLEALDLDMPLSWQYSTTPLGYKSERAFGLHFDTYPHRNICHARNFIRVGRILINESLIDSYLASPAGEQDPSLIETAREKINSLAGEICACVPQYVDCEGPARQRLPPSEVSEVPNQTRDENLGRGKVGTEHSHGLHHQADCYSLIFPLYTAGRSKAAPEVRPWVIKQLHYIGSHFFIRNAEVIAQILEGEIDVCPWEVYSNVGSYAFNA